jgi:hypothetical protein
MPEQNDKAYSQPVQVLVDDAHRDRLPEIAARLKAAGMRVEQQMDQIGILAGTLREDADLNALSTVEGVIAVERSDQLYQLPDNDAPVQ